MATGKPVSTSVLFQVMVSEALDLSILKVQDSAANPDSTGVDLANAFTPSCARLSSPWKKSPREFFSRKASVFFQEPLDVKETATSTPVKYVLPAVLVLPLEGRTL